MGQHGWTALTLPQEVTDGGTVDHAMYDWVKGIYFTSATSGFVATISTDPNGSNGGAVFGVSGGANLSVLASGTLLGDGFGNGEGFYGFYAAGSTIVVSTDHVGTVVVSTNGGASFAQMSSGSGFANAANEPLSFRSDSSGHWWTASNDGKLYTATSAPGPSTAWVDKTPPAATCDPPDTTNGDPQGGGGEGMNLQVSADGQTIVYPQSTVAVCVSKDGGGTWTKVTPPNPPAAAVTPQGRNIYFMDSTHGLLFGGDDLTGDVTFVYTTGDGGSTWTAATIPAQGADDIFELDQAFFAPDGQNGWFIGKKSLDDSAPPPLLWKSTDGGKTWADITTQSFTGTAIDPSGFSWLKAGFALDANHIWIGGFDGSLFANDNGGM